MINKQVLVRQFEEELDNIADFGKLQFFVSKHVGLLSKADYVQLKTTKYTHNEPNISLVADILRMIKNIDANGATGTLGFSINFKNGEAETLQLQDFQRL